jgi:flagellar basal body-associated protein FliL
LSGIKKIVCAVAVMSAVCFSGISSFAEKTQTSAAVNAVEYEADTSPVTGNADSPTGIILEKQLPEVESESKKPKGNPETGIIIAVIPAVLALGALIVSIILKKKK